jgi:secretory lipase
VPTVGQSWRARLSVGAVAASLVAGVVTVSTTSSGAATVPAPGADAFYRAPTNLAATLPGTVLRERAVSVAAYGYQPERVKAWQVLYRTTDTQGNPEAAVATILEPQGATPAHRPLISYQVAEDSLGSQCAPSYELRAGAASTNSVEQTEILLIDSLMERGWAVVVPDYEGPSSAYTGGVQAGHAVLDGIRAAERFTPDGLSPGSPVGMWGYSGGALATAWAAELQPSYAPNINLVATAAGGVPVNLGHIAQKINGGLFAGYYLAGVVGLSRAYPALASLLSTILLPSGVKAAAEVGTECNSTIVQQFAFKDITKYTNVPDPLALPVAQQVLAADTLGQHRPTGPLYIYQAVPDELIPIADVDHLVAGYCTQGVVVDYQRNEASDHLTLVGTGAFAALQWLQDRFTGQPAPDNCATGGTTSISTVTTPASVTTFLTYLAGLPRIL